MGIFTKLKFWKRDDDFGFENIANKEFGESGLPPSDDLGLDKKPMGTEETSPFDMPPQTEPREVAFTPRPPFQQAAFTSSPNRDLELLSSKLDTIKALLTSLDQRVANVERSMGGTKKEQRLW
ncbi:hypothetical protein COV17_00745 [Candidatus Woesearchaeota archaeon CG10_big_fil_rev_8_21_14_0_10_36_11]|nr:MAG: hypothetical protein COV17_00745 [Candidatus Woesearchaeota archaeon CG10_big_fil_rev_8_21_14_0_10_36_11]